MSRHGGVVRIDLRGEIDLCARPELAWAVARVRSGEVAVRVDMADVGFMDTSGVGFLWSLRERCRAVGAPLYLIGVGAQPRRLLDLVGFPVPGGLRA
ncbi:STAS domain-containing protein [Embleya scabrispora]|uniref:STAS domain-containing protein n=1 Tax=Embleya scabrispora TaxID=159449 RepID=UPI001374EEAB|nr:STAS domain-containing protein [Embleya scabrispora]